MDDFLCIDAQRRRRRRDRGAKKAEMKKILITGTNSYIGISFEQYLRQWPDQYAVKTIDMIDGSWRQKDFHGYDVVFHVAGIAHVKETKENKHLYYEINRDLAVETAKKSKAEGIGQFVFMSSMSVYGLEIGVIDKNTVPTPKTNYGKSKYQAEQQISTLADEQFKVVILRPPMIYGKGCKGNFQAIMSYLDKIFWFPNIDNQRSLLYIENFSSFVKMIVDNESYGTYFPQNREYLNTTQIAKWMAEVKNKRVYFSKVLGMTAKMLFCFSKYARKAFGTLIYKDCEDFDFNYCIVDNEESVKRSVTC